MPVQDSLPTFLWGCPFMWPSCPSLMLLSACTSLFEYISLLRASCDIGTGCMYKRDNAVALTCVFPRPWLSRYNFASHGGSTLRRLGPEGVIRGIVASYSVVQAYRLFVQVADPCLLFLLPLLNHNINQQVLLSQTTSLVCVLIHFLCQCYRAWVLNKIPGPPSKSIFWGHNPGNINV